MQRPPDQTLSARQPPTDDLFCMRQIWNLSHVHPTIHNFIREDHQEEYGGHIDIRETTKGTGMHINDLPRLRGYTYAGGEMCALNSV